MLNRTIILCVILFSSLANAEQASEHKGTIEVVISSANSNKGKIEVALISNELQFESKEPPLAVCRKSVDNLKATCKFKHIKHGYYSIFSYHDENKNNKLDENFFGLPKEKLAVSGIDLTQNQNPNFLQSKFKFNSKTAKIFINLQ